MINFKKISAIVATGLMAGMTMGVAAAANYPAPFVDGGVADVAIVVGTGAGVSTLDAFEAANIQTDLQANMGTSSTTSTATTTGGDSFKYEKTSTKWNYGKGFLDVVSTTLDDKDLPNILADGKYMDDDNDEFDFKQTVSVSNSTTFELFDDDDYQRDAPTLGLKYSDGNGVLNVTLDFIENPLWDDLTSTDLTLMDKSYFVLSTATNNTLTLLDSAETVLLSEGGSVSVAGLDASIDFIDADEVKLSLSGETTNSLNEGDTQKLTSGQYVGIKDILYDAKEGGISKVEFSVGNGKLVLAHGSEVQMNDEDIDNLDVSITSADSGNKLDTVVIQWNADEELFVTENSEITMPGFGSLKISMAGMTYPTEETTVATADGNDNFVLRDFPTKYGTMTIPLLESNGTNFTVIGKDSNNRLATAAPGDALTFIEGTDDYFILSYMSGDDAESYIVRATNFEDQDDPANVTDFEYYANGAWKNLDTGVNATDSVNLGSAEFTVYSVSSEAAKTVVLNASTNTYFHRMYSSEGLEVWLPWWNTTAVSVFNQTEYTAAAACTLGNISHTLANGEVGFDQVLTYNDSTTHASATTNCTSHPATYSLRFEEENKDDAISSGGAFTVAIGLDTDSEVYVTSITGDTSAYEVGETEVYRSFVHGALATELMDDQSGDHETVTITYHGGESFADIFVLSEAATVTAGSSGTTTATALGDVLYKDTESADFKDMNVIIVGGSCINSAAATVLGGAYCGAEFTEATGVGSGQWLIKSVAGAYAEGKIALVVAGYDAADTVNAATYLREKPVDTSKSYMGTTSTTAEEIVE